MSDGAPPYPVLRAMIASLAAADPDRAAARNHIGFSGAHAAQGHRLDGYARWNAAMAVDAYDLARHYRHTQLTAFDWQAAEIEFMAASAAAVLADVPSRAHAPAASPAALPAAAIATIPLPPAATAGADTVTSSARALLGPDGPIARALPGYEAREPQLQMAAAVEDAIRSGRRAAIEAGVGTGKSLAYAAAVLATGRSALISTADKGLQAQLATKDLPFLRDHSGIKFSVAVLKGRASYLCRERYEGLRERIAADSAQGALFVVSGEPPAPASFRTPAAAAAWPAVAVWAAATDDGDMESRDLAIDVPGDLRADLTVTADECSGEKCPYIETCFVERAKAAARAAKLVVVNHHLLLLDRAIRSRTDGMATVLPDTDVTIIDEAHHLEAVATAVLGEELSSGRIAREGRTLARLTTEHRGVTAFPKTSERRALAADWAAQMRDIEAGFAELFAAIARRMGRAPRATLGDERALAGPLAAELRQMAAAMREYTPLWLESEGDRAKWGKLRARLETLAGALAAVTAPAQGTVRYAEREPDRPGGQITLYAKPVDVSGELRALLWEQRPDAPVIATSATIATGDGLAYWRGRVGLDVADELVVPAPFDYRRAGLLYLPADGRALDPTAGRGEDAPEYVQRLAAEMERLMLAAGGRTFLLFTSRRMLVAVYDRLASRLPYTVLRQGDAPRPALVERFKADGRAVLFGLKSFWEGVDVAGDALSLVIIDKLPFTPPDDPVWQARCDAVTAATGDRWAWFHQLATPEAVIALKQGTGRLIRSRTDRGVVAILDGRLTVKPYGARIVAALPPFRQTRSIEEVRAFFATAVSPRQ